MTALGRVVNYAPRVINYTPRVMLLIVSSLTMIVYDRNMFIVHATGPFTALDYRIKIMTSL
jgi:hypothetical protein